jgi:hypothetical protein
MNIQIFDNKVVIDSVEFFKEPSELTKAKVAIEKWEWLTHWATQETENARDLLEDMKKDGLSIGQVEAEGFCRAMAVLNSQIEHINSLVD